MKFLTVCVLILVAVTALHADVSPTRKRILVVKSRDIAFYNTTLQGFLTGLQSRGDYNPSTTELKVIVLTGNGTVDQQAIRDQLSKVNSLIFTLGTDATIAVANEHPTTPCLFSMLVDPVSLGIAKSLEQPGGEFTGTTLLVSPGKQLETLQQISSRVKRVGVLYTESDPTSTAFLALATQQALGLNIQIVAIAVKDYASSGQQSLQQLAGEVDAFWVIVDPSSAGPQAMADTLAIAKQHNLPVLGMSNANVHSGALLSLSGNLKDLGDVDAEMACPLLDGTMTPALMPVRGPRQTMLTLNLGTARSLGVTIPESVLSLADEVIDGGSTPGN